MRLQPGKVCDKGSPTFAWHDLERGGGTFCEQAFTRADLIAVTAVLLLLAGWFGMRHWGEAGRTAQCGRNLQVLGTAMQNYANEHGSALPAAGVEAPLTAWSAELQPFLPGAPGKRANAQSPGARKQLASSAPNQAALERVFACPSDPIARDKKRSYAMSAHDMRPENWLPGPDNETGIGLVWSKAAVQRLLSQEARQAMASGKLEALPAVKLSWVPDPVNTLFLTELFHADNRLGRWGQVVTRAEEQVNALNGNFSRCHRGRFGYLMLDGHAEWLSPLQTGSWRGDVGIWTIRAGD
jgi:prepilin-type processing-associated H-X9-DG protein